MRVLVVEDARRLADAIARGLRAEGMAVDVAYDGLEGHQKSTFTRYDVVVLDRDLPEMHGDDLLAEIVAAGDLTRVLLLTASAGVDDRVDGLSLGADDYLSKPFAFPELVARVRALGRRATPAAPPVLRAGDLELDPARRTVTRAGRPIELTRKEFGVLEVLLAARGSVVSSEDLLERVWDENADPFTTTVRVTMMTLRRKLGEPGLIDTVVGAGYRVAAGRRRPARRAAIRRRDGPPAAAGPAAGPAGPADAAHAAVHRAAGADRRAAAGAVLPGGRAGGGGAAAVSGRHPGAGRRPGDGRLPGGRARSPRRAGRPCWSSG